MIRVSQIVKAFDNSIWQRWKLDCSMSSASLYHSYIIPGAIVMASAIDTMYQAPEWAVVLWNLVRTYLTGNSQYIVVWRMLCIVHAVVGMMIALKPCRTLVERYNFLHNVNGCQYPRMNLLNWRQPQWHYNGMCKPLENECCHNCYFMQHHQRLHI